MAVVIISEPINDTPLAEIVGRHLDQHVIALGNFDVVLAHAAGDPRPRGASLVQFDPEISTAFVGEHDATRFELRLFHLSSSSNKPGGGIAGTGTASPVPSPVGTRFRVVLCGGGPNTSVLAACALKAAPFRGQCASSRGRLFGGRLGRGTIMNF